MARIKVVCGLGNPGPEYEHTRHNVGYDIIDRLARRLGLSRNQRAAGFEFRTLTAGTGEVHLIQPVTYVNRSGLAVREALDRFRAQPGELFVISDDFHLPLGALRIRTSGSAGGHNGLQSIIDELGTIEFSRLRAGIGPLPDEIAGQSELIVDFVLSRFRPDEEEIVSNMISHAVEAVERVIADGLDPAISKNNGANPTPES